MSATHSVCNDVKVKYTIFTYIDVKVKDTNLMVVVNNYSQSVYMYPCYFLCQIQCYHKFSNVMVC